MNHCSFLKDNYFHCDLLKLVCSSYYMVFCRLVLKSIGYRSIPVDGLPFDNQKGEQMMCISHFLLISIFYVLLWTISVYFQNLFLGNLLLEIINDKFGNHFHFFSIREKRWPSNLIYIIVANQIHFSYNFLYWLLCSIMYRHASRVKWCLHVLALTTLWRNSLYLIFN